MTTAKTSEKHIYQRIGRLADSAICVNSCVHDDDRGNIC